MEGAPLEVLLDGSHSAPWNMAVDEILLESPIPWFRVYRWWPRALSLGYFQKTEEFETQNSRIEWIRRPTGGGAILHEDEWTLSLALPSTDLGPGITPSYLPLHDAVRAALKDLRVPLAPPSGECTPPSHSHARANTAWCFDDPIPMDLLSPSGRKVFGSAQRRRGDRILHHGSLILSPPKENPGAGFLSSFPCHNLPSLLAHHIALKLQKKTRIHLRLPKALCALAEERARGKYSSSEWNEKR
jgi:lipoate-protein ligase A